MYAENLVIYKVLLVGIHDAHRLHRRLHIRRCHNLTQTLPRICMMHAGYTGGFGSALMEKDLSLGKHMLVYQI